MDHSHHQGHHHDNQMDHTDHSNHGNDAGYTVITDTPHHPGGHHGGHHDSSQHHQSFFNNQFNVTILFENWEMNSRTHIFWACLVTALLAIGYQGTKWLRTYLHANFKDKRHTIRSKEHLIQTFLYGIEFLISYILMLVVMTYNVWILVVTILAIGVGYFLFGWHRYVKDSYSETCPNIAEKRNLEYDRNPSSQELVPLGREQTFEFDMERNIDRETDIIT